MRIMQQLTSVVPVSHLERSSVIERTGACRRCWSVVCLVGESEIATGGRMSNKLKRDQSVHPLLVFRIPCMYVEQNTGHFFVSSTKFEYCNLKD